MDRSRELLFYFFGDVAVNREFPAEDWLSFSILRKRLIGNGNIKPTVLRKISKGANSGVGIDSTKAFVALD